VSQRQVLLKELHQIAQAAGREVCARGRFEGTPRSVAFDVQWFRVAVDPDTGELRILRSLHVADAGQVMNPMRCRGQVEGGVAQALGPAMSEQVQLDGHGTGHNPPRSARIGCRRSQTCRTPRSTSSAPPTRSARSGPSP
jgi:CO/xanthine dehydrogenase Mo-binding subunit